MTLMVGIRLIRVTAFSLLCVAAQAGYAEQSLSQRIDSLIEAKSAGQPLATVADDAEFLRKSLRPARIENRRAVPPWIF